MNTINIPIRDLLNTVERPIVFDIIRKVQDISGVSSKTTVRYYGEDAKAAQWNSRLTKSDDTHNLWPHVENLTIEVEEDFNTDQMWAVAAKRPDVPFIFLDKELGVYIKPVYSSQLVNIHFKYKARDRNQAIRWRNEIRTRTAMHRDINMHEITYSYHLPEQYLDILDAIYTCRSKVAGYNDTVEEWFGKCVTERITRVTNLAGTSAVLAVAERQTQIQGFFDFEGVPDKPNKEDDHEVWTIEFNYKFWYDKPINTVCHYPTVIHQQLLDKKYRFNHKAYSVQEQFKSYSSSGEDFAHFQIDNQNLRALANQGLTIPDFDQFVPNSIVPSTLRVCTVLNLITEADRRTLFNLKELGDYNLHKDILDFMEQSEYPFMGVAFQSIFVLSLYENENIQPDGCLVVDSQLNITSTYDLDLRKTYRVRLSMVGDMQRLTKAALERLKRFPAAFAKIIVALQHALKNSGSQKDLIKNGLNNLDKVLLGLNDVNKGLARTNYGERATGLLKPPEKPYIYSPPFDKSGNIFIDGIDLGNIQDMGHSLIQTLFIRAKRMSSYPETPRGNAQAASAQLSMKAI